jgi:solute:Na+ symporter, SSS family
MIFIMPIAIGWWANWYPGAEPGGGSYIAQRMLASKSEKDSLGAVLFFNFAHYVLRPWPWIITGLCSIIIFPELKDIKAAFPDADPGLIGHDSAFPAMLKFLPVGFVGLMVGGLIAANSSTILTHLNWGSSYLVHDFYRRFMVVSATEHHYVNVGRLCTVALYLLAALLSCVMSSAQDAFEILISIGAGTGLLYLLRWFWWRINAWCEVVAMAASFVISVAFFVLKKNGHEMPFAQSVIYSVAFTTVCWLLAAFFGPVTEPQQLAAFYRKVHPAGPGWTRVRLDAGVSEAEAALHSDHMGLATVGWITGCAAIWSSLFAIGNFLYGRLNYAFPLLGVFIVSGVILIYVVNKLWKGKPQIELSDKPSAPVSPTAAPM